MIKTLEISDVSDMLKEIESKNSLPKTMGELTDDELINELHISIKEDCKSAIELCVLFVNFRGLSSDVRIDYPELFV